MIARLFSEIVNGVWMLDKATADGLLPLITSLLKGEFDSNKIDFSQERLKSHNLRFATFSSGIYRISDYGQIAPPEKAPENSISVINITGIITKYDQYSGPAGTETKINLLQRADANKDIVAHILLIDSPGGEGYAYMGFADAIRKINKPVIAFIDDMAASAAYGLAAAADSIYANADMAKAGSIGTYVQVIDYERFWEKEGLKIHEIYATVSKDKNRPYYEAIKGNPDMIRADVDIFNEQFLKNIENDRGNALNSKRNQWGTGKMFYAEDALKLGLIDGILSLEETIKTIYEEII